jgi:hypothetical protein
VPTETGAAFFIDSDYAELDAANGPIQLAIYGPCDVSPGEAAIVRARLEADLFTYAAAAARFGQRWRQHALVALIELAILGVLVAFLIGNPSRMAFVIGWTLPFGFFVAGRAALQAFAHREIGARARRLLASGVVLAEPATAQFGGSLAYVRDIWRGLEEGTIARDVVALELAAQQQLRWPGAVAFYRSLRGTSGDPRPHPPRARLARWLLPERPIAPLTTLVARPSA